MRKGLCRVNAIVVHATRQRQCLSGSLATSSHLAHAAYVRNQVPQALGGNIRCVDELAIKVVETAPGYGAAVLP